MDLYNFNADLPASGCIMLYAQSRLVFVNVLFINKSFRSLSSMCTSQLLFLSNKPIKDIYISAKFAAMLKLKDYYINTWHLMIESIGMITHSNPQMPWNEFVC